MKMEFVHFDFVCDFEDSFVDFMHLWSYFIAFSHVRTEQTEKALWNAFDVQFVLFYLFFFFVVVCQVSSQVIWNEFYLNNGFL